ncbi:MAG: carbohydrate ABC transporter permease [Ruminococcaceae bacterium]|nr:carbohydrate ABC transporter permease [Oscillospiraceae bacterium]
MSNLNKPTKVKLSSGDRIFYIGVDVMMIIIGLLVAVPILHIISASISQPSAVTQGKVFLLPQGFSLEGYKAVFRDDNILSGYGNTILYTVLGTVINVCLTIAAAYPLSRKDMPGRNWIMFLFTFSMMFSGGLIPTYLLVRDLKMINTIWALLLPYAINTYNMIVARTFFASTIPKELLEATRIDGGDDFTFFFKVVVPLSKSIIAVLSLYYAVAAWNSYFSAFLYLNDQKKFPLQLVLRDILIGNTMSSEMAESASVVQNDLSGILKYASIICASLPVWIIYPIVQKHFVKGVMIGSIKG